MAYQINRFNNALLTTVEDGTVDQTTDIKFVGKNYSGYGEIQNENFLFLLENFAGTTQPPRAISGQMWYDSTNKKMKFYDGTKFRTAGGSEVSGTEPSGLTAGDFWWDSNNDQLYVYNGTEFILVGPQSVGDTTTQLQSRVIKDVSNVDHPVIVSVVDNIVVHVISSDEFTIKAGDPSAIDGFDVIKQGITLRDTKASTNGVTSTDYIFWGTASNSSRLGGLPASSYIKTDSANFTVQGKFPDAGIVIGNSEDLKIGIENDNEGFISNTVGLSNKIKFKANNASGSLTHSLTVDATGLVPAADSLFDLGSNVSKFRTLYVDEISGTSTRADSLLVGVDYRSAATTAAVNTIAARDSSGNLTANQFLGQATTANKLTSSRNITLSGVVSGNTSFDGSSNVTITTTTTTSPTLTVTGDVVDTSATFTNLGDATLNLTVKNNSHTHIIANISGLQDALNNIDAADIVSGTLSVNRLPASVVRTDNTQTISGAKTFTANTTFDGGTLFVNAATNRVGVGTISPAQSLHVVGQILATNDITAFYSDERLKTFDGKIENALDKISKLNGYYYYQNKKAENLGFPINKKRMVGVSAQEVEKVLPEVVSLAPFDTDENNSTKTGENYMTVKYEKMIGLLIEAIKELKTEFDQLREDINGL